MGCPTTLCCTYGTFLTRFGFQTMRLGSRRRTPGVQAANTRPGICSPVCFHHFPQRMYFDFGLQTMACCQAWLVRAGTLAHCRVGCTTAVQDRLVGLQAGVTQDDRWILFGMFLFVWGAERSMSKAWVVQLYQQPIDLSRQSRTGVMSPCHDCVSAGWISCGVNCNDRRSLVVVYELFACAARP